jgi:hypothetical protein
MYADEAARADEQKSRLQRCTAAQQQQLSRVV